MRDNDMDTLRKKIARLEKENESLHDTLETVMTNATEYANIALKVAERIAIVCSVLRITTATNVTDDTLDIMRAALEIGDDGYPRLELFDGER